MSSGDGGLPTGPAAGLASFTSIAGSPTTRSRSRITRRSGSVPGISLRLIAACADPGMTLLREAGVHHHRRNRVADYRVQEGIFADLEVGARNGRPVGAFGQRPEMIRQRRRTRPRQHREESPRNRNQLDRRIVIGKTSGAPSTARRSRCRSGASTSVSSYRGRSRSPRVILCRPSRC